MQEDPLLQRIRKFDHVCSCVSDYSNDTFMREIKHERDINDLEKISYYRDIHSIQNTNYLIKMTVLQRTLRKRSSDGPLTFCSKYRNQCMRINSLRNGFAR